MFIGLLFWLFLYCPFRHQSYKLVPIVREETLLTEAEFYAKIDLALKEVQQGKITEIKNSEDFRSLLGI